MILILFVIGMAFIVFGIHRLSKRQNKLALFFLIVGITIIFIGYFVAHIYPQTLPQFLRTFSF